MPHQYGSIASSKDEKAFYTVISESRAWKETESDVIFIDDFSDEEDDGLHLKSSTVKAELVTSQNEMDGKSNVKQEMEELPPEEGWLNMKMYDASRQTIPAFKSSVHLTEILTTWLPPCKSSGLNAPLGSHDKMPSKGTETTDNDKHTSVDPSVVQRRKYKHGVHHPKYMILFEKGGSVVVVVSTGNLTRPMSTDASWVQRFGRAESCSKITSKMRQDGSDFGHVMDNFLQCQSNAAREGQMIPQAFIKRYLGMGSLNEFRKLYCTSLRMRRFT